LQKKLVFFLLLLQVVSAMKKDYKLITQFMEKVNPEIFYWHFAETKTRTIQRQLSMIPIIFCA